MRTLLICPQNRPETAALADSGPLSNVTLLGKTVIEYWIEHLVGRGAREIFILATDRPEQVRALVGTGCRWGIRTMVFPEKHELTAAEARRRYRDDDSAWLAAPDDINVMDHLPGLAEFPLFTSYADWMAALRRKLPCALTPERIGCREIAPGIWIGLHARIAPDAELIAPCWIGDHALISRGAIIGPEAVIENESCIERHAVVAHSVVQPKTFVGEATELRHSIASGSTLINWRLNSVIKVTDAFLLSPLTKRPSAFRSVSCLSRLAALGALVLTAPLALVSLAWANAHGRRGFRPLLAVRPHFREAPPVTGDTLVYYELSNASGWLRRWPQLWNIVRGQFAWVGNRPLSPQQAARLTNDFERLWLTTRLGWLCLADTESGCDVRAEEARAHASYYAAHAHWWLDWKIFLRAVFLFLFGISVTRVREAGLRLIPLRNELKAFL